MVWRQNALRAYRALLLAYPAEFRHEYGEEMEHLFAMRLEREPRLRLWLEVLADVVLTAPREHLQILAGDLRYGARVLAKAPGFVFAALLAIVLGVSATTTVFSLINAVLIRSLPYGNAERLVYMWTPVPDAAGLPREFPPYFANMDAWRRQSRSFQDITAMQRYIALLDDGSAERVGAGRVLGNFFETLEATAQLGRTIDAEDDHPDKQLTVVISDGLWHSRFGGDPAVLGKTVHMDRRSYRVIGVMPREFSYPHGNDFPGQYEYGSLPRTDVWVPAALTLKQQADNGLEFDAVIGRLRPGVSLSRAQSEISAIQNRLEPIHPEGRMQARLVPFIETTIGPVRPLLHLLMGAVCLVLLLACGNLASLLMARVADRVHEIGVRTALGAQRSRLFRLMLTESLMLSAGGGTLAVPLSYAALEVVAKLNPGDIPRFEETTLDMRVLLFGLFIAVGTGLVAGIFPAVSASFVNVGELLRQGGRGIAGVSWRVRNTLIVSEIALAVILLAGAGLMIRSYLVVQGEDKGFAPSTLTMSVVLDQQDSKLGTTASRELMDRIQAVPGVQVAGSIGDLPLSSAEDKAFIEVEGYRSHLKEFESVRETGGEYFRAMQIPLIAGRYLTDGDIEPRTDVMPHAVVVSKSFAKHYFPGRDAVGRRLRINAGGWGSGWSTLVGVVGDIRHTNLEEAPAPIIYVQNGVADSLVIRTIGPPDAIIPSIRRVVSSLKAGIALTDVQTMGQYVDQAAARRRFQTVALTSFAGVAVFLALVGLYGLLSYAVRQRTQEIGVRMALGASRGAVVGMVVLYGLKLTSAGLAIGVCLSLALTRVVASFLYGVGAVDPVTFTAVPALVIAVAVAACITPAWSAACIDPVSALRQQ
jgi:putative ABC transport system permease protein